jgi:outer membrane protein assembly factor BamA
LSVFSRAGIARVAPLLLILLLSIAVAPRLRAADAAQPFGVVQEITFSGNEDTSELLLRDELGFAEGVIFTAERMQQGRQALMDLGLFSEVLAEAEQLADGVRLHYTIDEKYYLLPLPRLSRTSDGEISFGGQLRIDNMFGLNHQFRLTLERKKENDGRGRETDKLGVSYRIPHIIHSNWGIGVSLSEERYPVGTEEGDEVDGEWQRSHRSLGVGFTRKLDDWLIDDPGWTLGFGRSEAERSHEPLGDTIGTEPAAGYERSVFFSLGFDDVHESRFRRFGEAWGGSYVTAGGMFGGDYDYNSLHLYYRQYRPLDDVADNLNLSIQFGYATGDAWGDERFSLGSSSTLRGVEADSVTGDSMFLLNVEWLKALASHPRFRFVFFSDIGNAWPRYNFDLLDLRATVGTGFRWKLDSFVRTDLRFDIGYDVEGGDGKIYAGTSVAF